jgi:HAD superfamily hydrolase (TIGR01509 family)
MAKPQALLFDTDGTIADTEELHRWSYNQAFLRANTDWNWDPDQYVRLLAVSGGHDRLASYVDRLAVPDDEKNRLRQLLPHIHRTKTEEYAARLQEGHIKPRPGVIRLIEQASAAGLKIGFVSSSAWSNVTALLAAALSSLNGPEIGAVVNTEMVPRKKPAPDVYELLMGMLRVASRDCVVVEDSANGVRSARAAGLCVVATPSRWTSHQDFSQANLVLRSLGDPDAPLDPDDAARIGGARWLGLEQITELWSRSAPTPAAPTPTLMAGT